jgi:hypothetical protein
MAASSSATSDSANRGGANMASSTAARRAGLCNCGITQTLKGELLNRLVVSACEPFEAAHQVIRHVDRQVHSAHLVSTLTFPIGTPLFLAKGAERQGMRITVRRILELLATHPDRNAILLEYPFLQAQDLQQALRYATAAVHERLSTNRVA